MKKFIVWYNGWKIEVDAESKKQARHRAWVKFNDAYPTSYGTFMRNIENVEATVCI